MCMCVYIFVCSERTWSAVDLLANIYIKPFLTTCISVLTGVEG